ncbi:molybdopterin oxidoreductase family protein [Halorarum halobium]|uniref:molybdopterin oxidoreductase family protein n=1 Tax=Halorarum halobium TaxID=3075121 RepID=UPI0028ABA853|nr:molybdopterin-dependent oxidoreductase [Halobaculum sp. XH14]
MSDRPSPPTVCPGCAVGCRLEPGEDSRARGVVGAANPNGRLCRTGIDAFDVGDERLVRPRVRHDGDLRAVSWETAYDRAIAGLEAVLAAHGPDGLAFLGAPHSTNEENYLLGKLARTLGTNNVDNRARLCHVSTARALRERVGWPATTNGLADLGEADLLIVAGANPAERQPVAFDGFVRPAVADGTTLVHVDPVGNRTTRLADVHLAPRPGTDATAFDLLNAHLLDGGDAVDEAFVAERTRGYDRFAASVADLDREAAVSATGVDESTIARVAELVADADRVAALSGTGIEGGTEEVDGTDHVDGADPVDGADEVDARNGATAAGSLLDLLLVTGNVGRRGTGLFVLRGLVNEQGATDAGCVPDRLPGHRPVTDPDARDRIEAAWGVAPPATPGKTATELLSAFGDGVHGALVVGENPAVSKRDPDWIGRRLDALDALVVLEVAPSATTRHADVLLPAAAGVEKTGTVTNLERRVQRLRRTSGPPGDARTDFTVLRDLGRRLFPTDGYFEYADVSAVFDELSRVAPTHQGLSYADIDAEGRRWPFEDDDGVLYRESFETPDGRAAFGTAGPVPEVGPADGLHLIAGGRASEFPDEDAGGNRPLRMHPADAADRGVDAGEPVVVSAGAVAVETVVALDERGRRGTVHLPAAAADPLLRGGTSTVAVEPTSDPRGEPN